MPAFARLLAACLPLLLALPAAFAAGLVDVVAAAKPSVVLVGGFRPTDSPRFTFRGTGFVVGDGRQVVTNAHVLPETLSDDPSSKATLMVQVRQGGAWQGRAATVQATDREHDLAVLRIEGEPAPALALADGDDVREGQAVALIGFPIGGALGFSPVTHRGIVSSIAPAALPAAAARQLGEASLRRLRDEPFDIYQLDATAYPGNSGGPLLDADGGRVLGVVSFAAIKSTRESALSQPSGISYAVPVRHVRALLGRR